MLILLRIPLSRFYISLVTEFENYLDFQLQTVQEFQTSTKEAWNTFGMRMDHGDPLSTLTILDSSRQKVKKNMGLSQS